MAWYTVDMVKQVFVFNIKPNVWVNIEQISGIRFKNPSIIYQFKKCNAKKPLWNGIISLQGSYPNYMFNVDSSSINTNDSLISVLIMDGDV